jgi:hypothetical protein
LHLDRDREFLFCLLDDSAAQCIRDARRPTTGGSCRLAVGVAEQFGRSEDVPLIDIGCGPFFTSSVG